MCNLLGWSNFGGHAKEKLTIMMIQEKVNGDGSGVYSIDENYLRYMIKSPKGIEGMEQAELMKMLDAPYALCHTRLATHGNLTTDNCHPFYNARHDLAFAHNGILRDYEHRAELASELQNDTDSEIVLAYMARGLSIGRTPVRALKDALAKVSGWGVFEIMLTNGDVLLYAERGELHYAKIGKGLVWATKAEQLYCLSGNGKLKIKELPQSTIVHVSKGKIAERHKDCLMRRWGVTVDMSEVLSCGL